MLNDDAATQTEETPVVTDNVIFVSPSERLLVNLHVRPQRKYSSGGIIVIEEEIKKVQFVEGRYETSDPNLIELLRAAPNNVSQLEADISNQYQQRGIHATPDGTALGSHKDRFYEVAGEGAA
tara:strand:+ start:337 stop:705 length:369 start_codon:yes stop_codon:yes gene_type:complete